MATEALGIFSTDEAKFNAAVALAAKAPLTNAWDIEWAPADHVTSIPFATPIPLPWRPDVKVDALPVPGRAVLSSAEGLYTSPLQALYAVVARTAAKHARMVSMKMPPTLIEADQSNVEAALEDLCAHARGEPERWSPLDLEAVKEELPKVEAATLRRPSAPRNRVGLGSLPPHDPIDIAFVHDGVVVSYRFAVAHIELPSGRVRAVVPGGGVRFAAVSRDGARVLCRPDYARTYVWPDFHVYDARSNAWRTDLESLVGLPKVLPDGFVLHDLHALTSFTSVVARCSDCSPSEFTTSHDGTLMWPNLRPGCDEMGVLDTRTGHRMYLLPEDRARRDAVKYNSNDESWLDFGGRAIARTERGYAAFAGGALYFNDGATYRCANTRAAAFDSDATRLAVANRDALDVVMLGSAGQGISSLRLDLESLRHELTLNDFRFRVDFAESESRVMAAIGTISGAPSLESLEAFETAVAESDFSGELEAPLAPLWDALSEHETSSLKLPVSEGPPRETLPSGLLGFRAFVAKLPRWVSTRGTSHEDVVAKLVAQGARIVDHHDHDICGFEWRLVDAHGPIHVLQGKGLEHVLAVAQSSSSLACLGEPIVEADSLIQRALLSSPADPFSELSAAIEGYDFELDLTWAVGLRGTRAVVERLHARSREEYDPYGEQVCILTALAQERWPDDKPLENV